MRPPPPPPAGRGGQAPLWCGYKQLGCPRGRLVLAGTSQVVCEVPLPVSEVVLHCTLVLSQSAAPYTHTPALLPSVKRQVFSISDRTLATFLYVPSVVCDLTCLVCTILKLPHHSPSVLKMEQSC